MNRLRMMVCKTKDPQVSMSECPFEESDDGTKIVCSECGQEFPQEAEAPEAPPEEDDG